MEDKILGSESSSKSYIGAEGEAKSASASVSLTDIQSAITASTQQGGLNVLPAGFDAANGYWKCIHSDNPFEVLFLDYKQYLKITPEIIKKNFDLLNAFWSDKSKLLTSGSREKIKKRFGEDTVTQASKKLEDSYNKLRTKEGIDVYFKEIDGKRYSNGIKAIDTYVRLSLADGELTRQEANTIIAEGLKNQLNEVEVRNLLLNELLTHNFKPTKNFPDILDNHWMTDDRRMMLQSRTTTVFGTTVSTLEEIGNVLFYNKEKAFNYLKNANYLPVEITKLQSSDKAMEFEEIMNSESDIEKRYLKVVYHLNPALPLVIDKDSFPTINHLFDKTTYDFDLFLKAGIIYQQGLIHVWLTECDPVNAAKLTTGFDYNSFLNFIFKINEKHALFINHERFADPFQLIDKAKKDKSYWSKISDAMLTGQLPVWFTGIGRYEWVVEYNKRTEIFIDSKYYSTEDKKLAAVQTLIQIIDPDAVPPRIISVPKSVRLLSLEGSHTMVQLILLKLENEGFLKAEIFLDKAIEGIWLNAREVTFQSQTGNTEAKVILNIEALKLIKEKVYVLNILVRTVYETLTIPVEIKVIFPKKAYYTQLIKYAVIGAIFFAGIRFLIGEITGRDSWLQNEYSPNTYNYFAYFIVLVLLIAGLVGSIFIIKKVEKL